MFIPIKTALHEETQNLPDPRHCRGLTSGKFRKHALIFYADANRTEIHGFVQIMAASNQDIYSCEIISVFFQLLRCTNGRISHNIHNSQLPYLTINHATTCPVEICHSQLPQNQPPRRSQRRPPQRLPTNLRSSSKLSKGRNLRIFAPKSKPSQEDPFIFHLFDFQKRKSEF